MQIMYQETVDEQHSNFIQRGGATSYSMRGGSGVTMACGPSWLPLYPLYDTTEVEFIGW